MPIAADYPFLDILWTMILFFTWVAWIWILIVIFTDLFRRRDVSGWGKAAWVVFLIILPFLGALVYLIARGRGMAERSGRAQQQARSETDNYIRTVASTSSADEIAKAKALLDAGTITQSEFDLLKSKAVAGG